MSHLRSFNRFILISLALLGLFVSPAKSDTVDHFGVLGTPIPYFDSGLGILESVHVDYWIEEEIFFDVLIGVNPGPFSFDIEMMGESILAGGPSLLPASPFFETFMFDFLLASPLEQFFFPAPTAIPGTATLVGAGEVSPYIDVGFYVLFPAIVSLGCSSPTTGVAVFGCFEGATTGHFDLTYTYTPPSAVPVPAAVWLFGTGILGLIGFSRRRNQLTS